SYSDDQPAWSCPRALVRSAEYSTLSTGAYLLSVGSRIMTAAITIGASSGLAAGRRTVRCLGMGSSGMGRLATVTVAAGHDSASARETPVDFGSNFYRDVRQVWQ